jgi:signal transduction histidine kinase
VRTPGSRAAASAAIRDTESMVRRLRVLGYLIAGLPLGAVDAAVLLAGWVVVTVLAITPLVVPALLAFRAATGGLAWVEAQLANKLLGADVEPPLRSPGRGFWGSAAGVGADSAFYRQQVFLLQAYVLRGAVAVAELSLLAAGAGSTAIPLYYRWGSTDVLSRHVDTLGRALLFVPVGLAALALGIYLLGPIGKLFRKLADLLLRPVPPPTTVSETRRRRRRTLAAHALFSAAIGAVVVLVWGTTGAGTFWPGYVLLSLALLLGFHACVVAVLEHHDEIRRRRLTPAVAIEAGFAVLLSLFLVGVWAVSGGDYFWPAWAILAFVGVVGGHAALTWRDGGSRRIAQLESTRAAAVDAQDTELRRIERDLHDGAQARLVALGMSLGMAEQKLSSDPAAAQALLAEARVGAQEALAELRDLARGIHPPVLSDRGLEAAISTLADRSPLHVDLSVDLPARPAPAVETAAYFVAAEALANAGKHAGAETVAIDAHRDGDTLALAITDDGQGGADPNGAGLRGLRQRVEALDGTLTVTSPDGGPTTVRAVIPCGW